MTVVLLERLYPASREGPGLVFKNRESVNFFTDALGGSRTFQRYRLSGAWYTPVRGKQLVLVVSSRR
jgi:hypothetical protein